MDIIIGSSAIDRTEHAKRVVNKIAVQESDPNYPRHANPIGIASYLAQFPHTCDDCGESYWDRDEYGNAHFGCRGARRTTGF